MIAIVRPSVCQPGSYGRYVEVGEKNTTRILLAGATKGVGGRNVFSVLKLSVGSVWVGAYLEDESPLILGGDRREGICRGIFWAASCL